MAMAGTSADDGDDDHNKDLPSHHSHSRPQHQLASDDELLNIVNAFPDGIVHSFGYGSGVLAQQTSEHADVVNVDATEDRDERRGSSVSADNENAKGDSIDDEPPMIDVIFAVSDPVEWHRSNLALHPSHYSLVPRWLGPRFVAHLQTSYGAGLYFNPYVPAPPPRGTPTRGCFGPIPSGRLMKYGVISKGDLVRDLTEWKWLYAAGRLHKPTILIGHGDEEIMEAQKINVKAALASSLLLLGDDRGKSSRETSGEERWLDDPCERSVVSLPRLFKTIAGLSYGGDFRMEYNIEDPNKIDKLVGGGADGGSSNSATIQRWVDLYRDPLEELHRSGVIHCSLPERVEWDVTDEAARRHLLRCLPPRLQSLEDQLVVGPAAAALSPSRGTLQSPILASVLQSIVSPAARSQGIKGLVTAGVGRGMRYALAKMAKGRRRKK